MAGMAGMASSTGTRDHDIVTASAQQKEGTDTSTMPESAGNQQIKYRQKNRATMPISKPGQRWNQLTSMSSKLSC